MRKKKKNEFLKSDSITPNWDDYDKLIEVEKEHDESARLKKLVLLFFIPLIFILGFLYKSKFTPEVKSEKLEQYKAQQQEKNNEKKLLEANQIVLDAEEAFIKNDFHKAVFLYRQVIGHQSNNISIHEKLLLTLEKSCENENEIHCNAVEKAKEKVEALKEKK